MLSSRLTGLRRAPPALAALALTLAAAGCASPSGAPPAAVTAEQQWTQLKTLVGTWRTVPGSAMEATTEFRLVGAGSALEETIFRGTPHEMVTMYHLDGDALVLTHYCAAGNQPAMRAVPGADVSEIRFEFTRLGNGDPSKDVHMHDAVLRFGEDGRFRPTWSSWKDGKPGDFDAKLEFERAPHHVAVQGPH